MKAIFYNDVIFKTSNISIDINKLYVSLYNDDATIYFNDNNGNQFGIDLMADQSVVELFDDNGLLINKPFEILE